MRRIIGVVALCALLTGVSNVAAAYPEKPIRLVVSYPPGGASDVLARLVGQHLSSKWNVPVVVENRPGGNTQIGTQMIARAPADGYTFGLVNQALTLNHSLYGTLPYDSRQDFTPISLIASSPLVLFVNDEMEARTLGDLVDYSKRNPGKLNYSSAGSAMLAIGEMFRNASGVDAAPVSYKGSGPAVMAVASGEVSYTIETLLTARPLLEAKKLRALAAASTERLNVLPEVPTFTEAGLKGYTSFLWFGIVGPAGIPGDIVQKANQAINEILKLPEVEAQLSSLASSALHSSPEEFRKFLDAEFERYADVVKKNGLKP